ncbi:cytochrome c oxidase polypeptide Vb-like [Tropilaelaps mercedesae]|uniref:Cytochrome c oxidase polypeptide Vb-like n=1 Tax=Tropilaelaps mercedesae TaxID=418985 RepID=A0A1V9XYS8_9ACAR|nr:cytochrome c oxidase polypeptide Vb-like [Tropilaelaps mercedesae]
MASVLQHAARGLAVRGTRITPAANCVRTYAIKREIPDVMDHSTGIEKRELIALASGNKDPFQMEALKRGPGTKDQPNLVPSMTDKRMIGCICDEDSAAIVYMWLHKGDPKRCECGHWFKLVDGKFI